MQTGGVTWVIKLLCWTSTWASYRLLLGCRAILTLNILIMTKYQQSSSQDASQCNVHANSSLMKFLCCWGRKWTKTYSVKDIRIFLEFNFCSKIILGILSIELGVGQLEDGTATLLRCMKEFFFYPRYRDFFSTYLICPICRSGMSNIHMEASSSHLSPICHNNMLVWHLLR